MSFSDFVKPYPNGYIDGEAGNTPVTAAILNTNYDGFLLQLNDWATDIEEDIGSIQSTLNDKVDTSTFNQLGEAVRQIGLAVNSKSTVSISDLLQSGTKIATLTIDSTPYDIYAPSGGGGGSSVVWDQIQQTGTKIATITIDDVPVDVYVPTPIEELSDLTDVSITNLQNGQTLKWNSTTLKWENSNTSGGSGHTIIDENGTSMTAREGLQFTGGANVSDDATNNKTIVDLASAGGIDGVFIDTDNVIQSTTTFTDSMSYTATEDCVVAFYIVGKPNTDGLIKIDNKKVGGFYASSTVGFSCFYNLKEGQTITVTNAHASYSSDYTVYGIQTGTTHSKFQPVIYSFEEREIGVYTDGKPLYQKTFILNPTQATETIDISSLHIDKMVSRNTTCTRDTGSSGIQQKDVQYRSESVGSDTYGLICEIRGTDLYFDISGYSYSQITEIRTTLQYTKSTDTAGSGVWTPSGIPAFHYSEQEQVIGTWMGETLYQKTIELNNTSFDNDGYYQIDLGSMGIKNCFPDTSHSFYLFSSYERMFESIVQESDSDFLTNNYLYAKGTANRPITSGHITIQYTKSS